METHLQSQSLVPECPVFELSKICSAESLINALQEISYSYKEDCKESRNFHINLISERKEQFLCDLFDTKGADCFLSTSYFTLYASDMQEVEKIKSKARKLGFINIETYAAKWDTCYTGEKFPFGVNVNRSTEMKFGNEKVRIENLLKKTFPKFFDLIEEYTIYTYSYLGTLIITLNNLDVADSALENLEKIFADLEQHGKDTANAPIKIDIQKQVKIDTVSITFELKQKVH